jgi:threonine dehydrogenase-like Zn-dependent dehydrogenase
VYGTGYHAALEASIGPRTTVTVIGDGAVGLMAVLSARQLGAEQIILMGRHASRTDLGRAFGATDVVAERGAEGIERVTGQVDPGRVFDREVTLDQTPEGYQDMDARRALEVLIRP